MINATEEEEEKEKEKGAVLRGEFLGKNLHVHFLLITKFFLVSVAAMANPEIDDSLRVTTTKKINQKIMVGFVQ
jgi:hypothetical protein